MCHCVFCQEKGSPSGWQLRVQCLQAGEGGADAQEGFLFSERAAWAPRICFPASFSASPDARSTKWRPVTAFPLSFHHHLLSWPMIISGASLFPVDKDRRLAIIATLGPEGLEGLFCKHCPSAAIFNQAVLIRQMPFSLLHLNHLRELDSVDQWGT